jgi:hypothetical protein
MFSLFKQLSEAREAVAYTLPRSPHEPTVVVLAGADLIATRAVQAADVCVRIPRYARPGRAFEIKFDERDVLGTLDPETRSISAHSIALHATVDVHIVREGGEVAPLAASYEPSSADGGAKVYVMVPANADTLDGTTLILKGMSIAGQPIDTHPVVLPHRVPLSRGLCRPLFLRDATGIYSAPCVAGDGTLYTTCFQKSTVAVFSSSGDPLSPIPLAAVALSNEVRGAALCDATGTLFLADDWGSYGFIAAVDLATGRLKWKTSQGDFHRVFTVAVLSDAGVAFVPSMDDDMLYAHRISDGARLASVAVPSPMFVAACTEANTVFVSTADMRHPIVAFIWTGATGTLDPAGHIELPDLQVEHRAIQYTLAVVSRGVASSSGAHYLVAGLYRSSSLYIIELPSRRLVHTHSLSAWDDLPGTEQRTSARGISGLASDPGGSAIVVGDGKDLHVLLWPLDGMPKAGACSACD